MRVKWPIRGPYGLAQMDTELFRAELKNPIKIRTQYLRSKPTINRV